MTNILKIEGVRVIDYRLENEIGIILSIEKEEKTVQCPNCGNKTEKLHQNKRYTVRDLPWGEQSVYLKVNRRQMRCPHCGEKFSEALDFVGKKRTYTYRLKNKILSELVESDIKNVAKRNSVSEQEVETMLKEELQELRESPPQKLKKLGIDEIALVKGHKNYYVVLINLETSQVVGIIEKRKEETIKKYLEAWGEGLLKIGSWLKKSVQYFPSSCGTIMRWIGEIISYFDNRTTQGVVEGINNKLKLIKRRGYGFRNFENFKSRVALDEIF